MDSKKKYLVIGSNNFWYAMHSSLRAAQAEAKELLGKKSLPYGNPEEDYNPSRPKAVYIYEAREVERILANLK